MLQLSSKILARKGVRQLIKYGIVGVVGLVIDMSIYYLLVKRIEAHYPFSETMRRLFGLSISTRMLDILISSIVSSTIAVVNNFILNSYFTFKVTNNKLKRFLSFAGIALVGMAISSALLTIFIEYIELSEMVSKVLAIIIVAAMQFVINKHLTFKYKSDTERLM